MGLRTNSKTRFITKKIRFSQVMIEKDNFQGVKAIVQNTKIGFASIALFAFVAIALTGCPNATTTTPGSNETAATVNGKSITMEEVDRALKAEAQGQESKLSPLELAAARLQILEKLIQQEVLYQKAEKEAKVPNDEEVTAELNKRKTQSGMSQEEFQKQMTAAGMDEKSIRENIKKNLAINSLIEKITSRVEPPKDAEIEAFYKGNPELFIRKRGVRLAAIVVDPTNSGDGDKTIDDASTTLRINELLNKLRQPGSDFQALVNEYSEDPSKFQGGEIGDFSEEELKQSYPELAGGFMDPKFSVGGITNPQRINGKYYIFKLLERIEKDENLTLETQGVRQKVTDALINNRKQLLQQSYAVVAMNEAKIENYLARKVVDNPNDLSGARPAPTVDANANTANANANANANTNTNANAKTENKANTANANTANTNTKANK